jgi:hypothetical protein
VAAAQAEWQLNDFEIICKRRTFTKLLPSFSQKFDGALSRVRPTFPRCLLAWGLKITLDCER